MEFFSCVFVTSTMIYSIIIFFWSVLYEDHISVNVLIFNLNIFFLFSIFQATVCPLRSGKTIANNFEWLFSMYNLFFRLDSTKSMNCSTCYRIWPRKLLVIIKNRNVLTAFIDGPHYCTNTTTRCSVNSILVSN